LQLAMGSSGNGRRLVTGYCSFGRIAASMPYMHSHVLSGRSRPKQAFLGKVQNGRPWATSSLLSQATAAIGAACACRGCRTRSYCYVLRTCGASLGCCLGERRGFAFQKEREEKKTARTIKLSTCITARWRRSSDEARRQVALARANRRRRASPENSPSRKRLRKRGLHQP